MNSRPKYSFFAYQRKMQMSRKTLFIFVEGFQDRYVYSRIAESECQDRGIVYEVVTSYELPGAGEGKEKLLKFFDRLKRCSMLNDVFKGKSTVSIFFLDKDVDNFSRNRRRSEHVVYTKTYELENYLFMEGELSEAVATSASLDIQTVRAYLGDYAVWRQHAALQWKEWVTICLFSKIHKIGSMTTYQRHKSRINKEAYGSVMANEYKSCLSTLQRWSGLSSREFKHMFTRLARRVDKIYSLGQHDLIFKGKWYTCFLTENVQKIAGTKRHRSKYFQENLISSLAVTLNFQDVWAEHFREPIRRILVKAGIQIP